MAIHVTPIPRLTTLSVPAFTLGTANAAGTATTSVASDSTLLAFDTTPPAAVAASAAVGSATTAPRRDHVHPGITTAVPAFTLGTANAAGTATTSVASDSTLLAFDTTPPAAVAASAAVGSATTAPRRDHVHAGMSTTGSVVDEAITRFDGTSGTSLQGYSSLSPTISNAGIISLTSGALKFPASEIISTDANTMDDWQEGTFTPQLSDTSSAVSEGQSYSAQVGTYTKIGNRVLYQGYMDVDDIGSLSGGAFIVGLPFTSQNSSNNGAVVTVGKGIDLSLGTAGHNVTGEIPTNTAYISLQLWDVTGGTTGLTCAQYSNGGRLLFAGTYQTE